MEQGGRMKTILKSAVLVFILAISIQALAQQPLLPPPEKTDPVRLELMKGFPPPPEKVITFANSGKYPHHRWTFHHCRQLFPTVNIWRGRGEVAPLPSAPRDLDGISFDDDKGQKMTVAEWQKATYTDALLVIDKGRVAYERYYVGMRPEQQHILWSVTKSFTGTLTTLLIQEGKVDPNAKVPQYVPELADTAWGGRHRAADVGHDRRGPLPGGLYGSDNRGVSVRLRNRYAAASSQLSRSKNAL
jgi:hypothetical protein